MKVLFNASVVLAGLRSKKGASGELLRLVTINKIDGLISQIIFEKIVRHSHKLGLDSKSVKSKILSIFVKNIVKSPQEKTVNIYSLKVSDPGDAHVLATYKEENCDALVTLDKKHLLILQGKIKGINIFSPGEFLVSKFR
ncbi:putative toxin-antitoxin system toxin component, PIN family [Candidatus Amesbacteria bacterium]|nr:putative toxin-antitoxin system toxin component, PIN family [Candidatus Amesbacteria bacterium]